MRNFTTFKRLLLITTLLASTLTYSACELTLGVKKEGAKTAYADDGVSVSQKIQNALAVQCKITKRVMPKSEVKAMNIARLTKQLAKLQEKDAK